MTSKVRGREGVEECVTECNIRGGGGIKATGTSAPRN